MANSTFTFKDASGAVQTAFAVLNSAILVPGAVICDASGAVIDKGQKTSANSFPVVLASDQSTLSVGGSTQVIRTYFIRPANTTAYVAGQVVANSTSAAVILQFANIARINNGTGVIFDAILTDESNPGTPGVFDLMLYDTSIGVQNDAVAFAPTVADQRTFLGKITFATSIACGGTSLQYHAIGLNIGFTCIGGARIVYGELVARNAYTPANLGRIDIALKVSQD